MRINHCYCSMEKPERCATVSENTIDRLLSEKDSNNTKKSTRPICRHIWGCRAGYYGCE